MIGNSTTNPLITLQADIEAHWRKYLPKIVAEMESKGTLQARVQEAFDLTEAAILEAVANGLDFWQAWAMWREEWAFLPPENQVGTYTGANDTWMSGWRPDAPFDNDNEPDYEDDTEGGIA